MSARAPLTVGDLVEALAAADVSATDEVRIVFHGRHRKSFNLPVLEARGGIQDDFVVVCFEEHARDDERPVDSSPDDETPMNGEPWTASVSPSDR